MKYRFKFNFYINTSLKFYMPFKVHTKEILHLLGENKVLSDILIIRIISTASECATAAVPAPPQQSGAIPIFTGS